MKKMKVLMVLEFAPDYREEFLRQLAAQCELTVVAQNCAKGNLTAPKERVGYSYIEIDSNKFLGFYFQPQLKNIIYSEGWDVLSISTNLRYLTRLFLFFTHKKLRNKWVWRGQVISKNSSKLLLKWFRKKLSLKAAFSLTYSNTELEWLTKLNANIVADTFNNSEASIEEFRKCIPFTKNHKNSLNLLFVGTNKPRKKLERFNNILDLFPNMSVRLIGKDIVDLSFNTSAEKKVELFPSMRGESLNEYFDWADIVVNPGSVGLLVVTAAKHGKPIVIDKYSSHGPEVEAAINSGQPFIDFSSKEEIKKFFDSVIESSNLLDKWSENLQSYVMKEYTIEHMVGKHIKAFSYVVQRNKAS